MTIGKRVHVSKSERLDKKKVILNTGDARESEKDTASLSFSQILTVIDESRHYNRKLYGTTLKAWFGACIVFDHNLDSEIKITKTAQQ